ncbi:hypothetical protein Q5752_002611 [Cryptotrichosporon argae]
MGDAGEDGSDDGGSVSSLKTRDPVDTLLAGRLAESNMHHAREFHSRGAASDELAIGNDTLGAGFTDSHDLRNVKFPDPVGDDDILAGMGPELTLSGGMYSASGCNNTYDEPWNPMAKRGT